MPSQKPGSNGYGAMNNYKRNNGMEANNLGTENKKSGNNVSNSINNAKKQQKKNATREVLKKAATAYNPALGKAVDVALRTKKGDQYLEEFAKAKTPKEGVVRVANKAKKEVIKKKILLTVGPPVLFLFVLMVVIPVIFKNSDSQIFSNENGGNVDSVSTYVNDEQVSDIFKDYPQLYEIINKATYAYSNDYGVDIDRSLVISTLIAPLENGIFDPYPCSNNDSKECTMYKGKEVEWDKFIETWGYNAYILSAMQMMTYVNIDYNNGNNKSGAPFCKPAPTNKQEIAKNDKEDNSCWGLSLFNHSETDVSFFQCIFADLFPETAAKLAARNELNINCTKAEKQSGSDDKYPEVRVLSIDEAEYEIINNTSKKAGGKNDNATSEVVDRSNKNTSKLREVDKNPDSGGIYFWNLVNEDGFIYNNLTKYSESSIKDADKDSSSNTTVPYQDVEAATYELASYIYDYYYSIRKDCRSVEIAPEPTESLTGSEFVAYDEKIENQVLEKLKEYYDSNYTDEHAMEYYKAMSVIIRSNLLHDDIIPNADEIGIEDKKLGMVKSEYNDSIDDKKIPFSDLEDIVKGTYGTRGIVITEKKKVDKVDKRVIKKIEIDRFCPQTYYPITNSLSSIHIGDEIITNGGNIFFLDIYQRELPVRHLTNSNGDGIEFYIGKYSEENGSKKDGIDCPCYTSLDDRPGFPEHKEWVNLWYVEGCAGLRNVTRTGNYKLYDIYASVLQYKLGLPVQQVRGMCYSQGDFDCHVIEPPPYHEAHITYTSGRKKMFPDYDEQNPQARGISTVALRYFANQGYNWRGLLRLFFDRTNDYDGKEYHVTFKRIDKSIQVQEKECVNHGYTKEKITIETSKCKKNSKEDCTVTIKDTTEKDW